MQRVLLNSHHPVIKTHDGGFSTYLLLDFVATETAVKAEESELLLPSVHLGSHAHELQSILRLCCIFPLVNFK